MSSAERPAKRVRQACDPCRRKKSRCPGERPICSYCARLGQPCSYSDDGYIDSRQSMGEAPVSNTPGRSSQSLPPQPLPQPPDTIDTTRRLNDLEEKLSAVLVALHDSRQQSSPARQVDTSLAYPPVTPSTDQVRPNRLTSGQVIRDSVQWQIAELYLTFCHCQPLPLFSPDDFAVKLHSRDEEVVLAITALAIRFSQNASVPTGSNEIAQGYLEKARSTTLRRVQDGPIELSTLQSLCLLSWLDFYGGNTQRSSMYASLASDLCMSAGLATKSVSDEVQHDEKLRCFWTVVLLQRLHVTVSAPFHISSDEDNIPPYPKSSPRPIELGQFAKATADNRMTDHKDLGIMAYAIQLTEVWYKVSRYAHRRATAGPYPPWSPKSDYARIIAHQMESETAMPYTKHRFKPVKFEERTSDEIFQHRGYWGPWLFTQILYHTMICVLNHPLLLSLRLRNFRVASVPEIWLQHADDLITQHSQWVILLIDLLDAKSFVVSDPFLAHCVAIVATIHLQQSFGGEDGVRQAKKDNFQKCLRFCQKVGEFWPYIRQLSQKLQHFERVVSQSYFNSAASNSNDKVFIDLGLFWEILESAVISDKPDANGLRFGQSLRTEPRPATAAEEINTRLLPETARVAAAGSPANGAYAQTPNALSNTLFTNNHQQYTANDDFAVLAQSYFAQGQDFVGNMDDWWLVDENHQTI